MMVQALRDIYSEKALETVKRESVFRGLVNDTYTGQAVYGGAVKIIKIDGVAAQDYNPATGIDSTQAQSTFVSIPINKIKVINLSIDGAYEKAIPASVMVEYVSKAGEQLAVAEDTDIIAAIKLGGTVSTNKTIITTTNVYSEILKEKLAMDKDKVAKKDRYIVVSPEIEGILLNSTEFIKNGDKGQGYLEEGVIGKIAGFYVKGCADLGTGVDFISLAKSQAVGFADGFAVPLDVNDIKDSKFIGTKFLQGRMDYGVAVLEPKAVRIRNTGTLV